MKPFQSGLTAKGLAVIWLVFFVGETAYLLIFPGPKGPHSLGTSLGSGFIEATLVAGLFLARAVFWPNRPK